MKEKLILDACCGGRMFWFDKKNKNVIYIDNRETNEGFFYNPGHRVKPDMLMDFRDLDFPDKKFKMVVFDPPHLVGGSDKSAIRKIYGALDKDTWKYDIKKGFDECWRVLDDYGTLVFKWNEVSVKRKEILEVIERTPLFGHQVGAKLATHWFCFMKIPE